MPPPGADPAAQRFDRTRSAGADTPKRGRRGGQPRAAPCSHLARQVHSKAVLLVSSSSKMSSSSLPAARAHTSVEAKSLFPSYDPVSPGKIHNLLDSDSNWLLPEKILPG